MRAIADMVRGVGAPLAPQAGAAKVMADLAWRECRFPVSGSGAATGFCAAAVEPDVWLPGRSLRSYCAFHRAFLAGCNRDGEAAA